MKRGILMILLVLLLLPAVVAIAQSVGIFFEPSSQSVVVGDSATIRLKYSVSIPEGTTCGSLNIEVVFTLPPELELVGFIDYVGSHTIHEKPEGGTIVLYSAYIESPEGGTLAKIVVKPKTVGVHSIEGTYSIELACVDPKGREYIVTDTKDITATITAKQPQQPQQRIGQIIAPYAGIGGLAAILASLFTPIQEYKTPLMILGALLLLLAFAGFMGLLPF